MAKFLNCEICGKEAKKVSGTQKTCLAPDCSKELRRRSRRKSYYANRKDPICDWCGDPIKEPLKRRFHAECMADKNRLRVKLYQMSHGYSPKYDPANPPKPRRYGTKVKCVYCGKKVERRSARQRTCVGADCVRKRKNEAHRRMRHRRRQQEIERQRKIKRSAKRIPAEELLKRVHKSRLG